MHYPSPLCAPCARGCCAPLRRLEFWAEISAAPALWHSLPAARRAGASTDLVFNGQLIVRIAIAAVFDLWNAGSDVQLFTQSRMVRSLLRRDALWCAAHESPLVITPTPAGNGVWFQWPAAAVARAAEPRRRQQLRDTAGSSAPLLKKPPPGPFPAAAALRAESPSSFSIGVHALTARGVQAGAELAPAAVFRQASDPDSAFRRSECWQRAMCIKPQVPRRGLRAGGARGQCL